MRKIKKPYPKVKKIDQGELTRLLARARSNTLTPEDCENIQGMAETIEFIIDMLGQKDIKLKRLLKQILGIKSEKSQKLFGADTSPEDTAGSKKSDKPAEKEGEKRKGHGRNGNECYTGAERISITHPTLKNADPCPQCPKGKLYREKKPGVFIYFEGQAPIRATVYELEKLRCNLCGVIFQAPLPEALAGISDTKHYDETAKSMMALLRYGYGLPLNRLANLQADLGIPLAASTVWDKSEEAADKIYPVFEALKNHAAQGDILHNDDTGMKVLELMREIEEEVKTANGKKVRTGIFTTGIISIAGGRKIGLFFTGRKHAGENISDLLAQRNPDRNPPIQMCDAKSGNNKEGAGVIECNCNTHARRYFADVTESFPDECAYVIIDVYKKIYKNDAIAKAENLTPDERLKFHREKSGPIMNQFHSWLKEQFEKRQVEPNSGLGQAITYVLNHWTQLTRFLDVPGAPLDNNICYAAIGITNIMPTAGLCRIARFLWDYSCFEVAADAA